MTYDPEGSRKAGPGRPRDEDVRKRILASAAYLLGEQGLKRVTIDSIAHHSGAGKSTIYRWWPDKAAVLIEAFRESVARELPFPRTGDLREDIRQQLRLFAKIMSGARGRIFFGFIAAAQTDATVAAAFRNMWIAPRRAESKQAFHEHQVSGALPTSLDLDCVVEILFSPLYYRLLTGWGPVSDEYIDLLTDTALNGLLNRG